MKERKCIFCDQGITENRAKEHIMPQWFLQHYKINNEKDLFQAVAKTQNSKIVESRTISAQSFVEGRVCDDCNNGWMSRLENDAKSLLVPLIDGTRTVLALSEDERLLLARWAAKTAYVLASAAPPNEPVDSRHLRFIAQNTRGLPPGVAVFGMQVARATEQFAYSVRNCWPEFSEVSREGPPLDGSYKVALGFRRLMLLTAYWPSESWEYALAAGLHIPLWPVRNFYPCYYARIGLPDRSASLLIQFSDALAALHRGSGRPGQ